MNGLRDISFWRTTFKQFMKERVKRCSRAEARQFVSFMLESLQMSMEDIRSEISEKYKVLNMIPPDLLPLNIKLVEGRKCTLIGVNPVLTVYDEELENPECDVVRAYLKRKGEELPEDFMPPKRVYCLKGSTGEAVRAKPPDNSAATSSTRSAVSYFITAQDSDVHKDHNYAKEPDREVIEISDEEKRDSSTTSEHCTSDLTDDNEIIQITSSEDEQSSSPLEIFIDGDSIVDTSDEETRDSSTTSKHCTSGLTDDNEIIQITSSEDEQISSPIKCDLDYDLIFDSIRDELNRSPSKDYTPCLINDPMLCILPPVMTDSYGNMQVSDTEDINPQAEETVAVDDTNATLVNEQYTWSFDQPMDQNTQE